LRVFDETLDAGRGGWRIQYGSRKYLTQLVSSEKDVVWRAVEEGVLIIDQVKAMTRIIVDIDTDYFG
jgi:sulfur carrier protein ThiS